jgi:hypothetical protein
MSRRRRACGLAPFLKMCYHRRWDGRASRWNRVCLKGHLTSVFIAVLSARRALSQRMTLLDRLGLSGAGSRVTT